MPTFYVTEHAIDRYIERIDGVTREDVRKAIEEHSSHALPLKTKTRDKALTCFRIPTTPMTLLCKRNEHGSGWVVVTIISSVQTDRWRPIVEDEMEILREAALEREEWLKKLSAECKPLPPVLGPALKPAKAPEVPKSSKKPKAKSEYVGPKTVEAALTSPLPKELPKAPLVEGPEMVAYRVLKERFKTERMRIAEDQRMARHFIREVLKWAQDRKWTDPELEAVLAIWEKRHPWAFTDKFLLADQEQGECP